MVDFTRLMAQDSAVRAERLRVSEAAHIERETRADIEKRHSLCRHQFVIELVEPIEVRTLRGGDCVATLRAKDMEGRSLIASYWFPSYYPDAPRRIYGLMPTGSRLTVQGYWKKRQWHDSDNLLHTAWEFRAQFLRHVVAAAV